MASRRNWKGGMADGAASEPPGVAAFEDAVRALLAVAPDPDASIAGALSDLRVALASGSVAVSRILGMRQFVRKAIRLAWTDGVTLPLVRSRDEADRLALAAIPDLSPIESTAELARCIARIRSALEPGATRDHLGRAAGLLAAVPVILQALQALEGLDPARRAHGADPSGVASPETLVTRKVVTARRRIRDVMRRGMPDLAMAVAAGLVEEPVPLTRGPAFKASRPLVDLAPAGVARLRDRAGMAWRAHLGDALCLDLCDGLLAREVEAVLRAHPRLAYETATLVTDGLSGTAAATLGHDGARVRVGLDFDARSGATRLAYGFSKDGSPLAEVTRSRLDAELAWEDPAPAPGP